MPLANSSDLTGVVQSLCGAQANNANKPGRNGECVPINGRFVHFADIVIPGPRRSEIEILPNIFLSARLASTTSRVRQEKSSSTFAPGSTRSTRRGQLDQQIHSTFISTASKAERCAIPIDQTCSRQASSQLVPAPKIQQRVACGPAMAVAGGALEVSDVQMCVFNRLEKSATWS